MPTVGTFATVFDSEGKVLCVKQNYKPFYWTTPGGRLESHEVPDEGVVREVYEETGYKVSIIRLVGVYAAPFKDDLVLGFAAKIVSRDQWSSNEEIAEVGFFPIDALPSPMKANTRVRIEDASQGVSSVYRVFRTLEDHSSVK